MRICPSLTLLRRMTGEGCLQVDCPKREVMVVLGVESHIRCVVVCVRKCVSHLSPAWTTDLAAGAPPCHAVRGCGPQKG